jgi:hypothetical protein
MGLVLLIDGYHVKILIFWIVMLFVVGDHLV